MLQKITLTILVSICFYTTYKTSKTGMTKELAKWNILTMTSLILIACTNLYLLYNNK